MALNRNDIYANKTQAGYANANPANVSRTKTIWKVFATSLFKVKSVSLKILHAINLILWHHCKSNASCHKQFPCDREQHYHVDPQCKVTENGRGDI